MRAFFDDARCPVAVDTTHPVDLLEPEDDGRIGADFDWLNVTEKVADTYLAGDPAVTRIAWRVLLGKEPESIRACARRAGCSAAAISKRVRILMEHFNLRMTKPHLRAMRGKIAREAWKKRRRKDRNPSAACDDQSKTNHHVEESGGRP